MHMKPVPPQSESIMQGEPMGNFCELRALAVPPSDDVPPPLLLLHATAASAAATMATHRAKLRFMILASNGTNKTCLWLPAQGTIRSNLVASSNQDALGRGVLSSDEKRALQRYAQDYRVSPVLAVRARIVLACAEGRLNGDVARELNVSIRVVGKWRRQFVEHRLEGLSFNAHRLPSESRISSVSRRRARP